MDDDNLQSMAAEADKNCLPGVVEEEDMVSGDTAIYYVSAALM